MRRLALIPCFFLIGCDTPRAIIPTGHFVLQGGTQYNMAAVKAQVDYIKERVPGAEVYVHPHSGEAGAIAAILLVDVLDDLLAALMRDIQVNVRRFSPLPGEKALEQQPHAHRVDRRDTQAIADG